MPFPKLSQLQSRLAASFTATVILLLVYFTISSPSFAYAAEVDSIRPEDHNHDRLFSFEDEAEELELREVTYEAEFFGFDRSIIGRAAADIIVLSNNEASNSNVVMGSSAYFTFPNASVWANSTNDDSASGLPSPIRRRDNELNLTLLQDEEDQWIPDNTNFEEEIKELKTRKVASGSTREVYISINTCLQPSSNTTAGPPPQLEVYVSLSDDNTRPGPNATDSTYVVTMDGGAGNALVNATGNVYIGLYAPNATGFNDIYNAEVAASTNAPYHYYNSSTSNLYLIDSDHEAALLETNNLTYSTSNTTLWKEWMNVSPPFTLFSSNHNDTSILGVQHSYCGLKNFAQVAGSNSMTARGMGNLPKQQIYVNGLNSSSSYYGILAFKENSTGAAVGGGGTVWQTMNFTTLSDNNCAVIFNLSFCDQVAYAVPGNPKSYSNFSSLAAFYDNSAQAMFQNFSYSLQQVPCNITSSGQYSLARTCDDCAAAYKQWLCSVTMPRCTDWYNPKTWLQERNIMQAFPNGTKLASSFTQPLQNVQYLNGSRNSAIDTTVKPGPYKEVLPCADLCYDIVQSCPASFGFGCPQPGDIGFNQSYGVRPDPMNPDQFGQITCNYPGAAFYLSSDAPLRKARDAWALVLGVIVALVVLVWI